MLEGNRSGMISGIPTVPSSINNRAILVAFYSFPMVRSRRRVFRGSEKSRASTHRANSHSDSRRRQWRLPDGLFLFVVLSIFGCSQPNSEDLARRVPSKSPPTLASPKTPASTELDTKAGIDAALRTEDLDSASQSTGHSDALANKEANTDPIKPQEPANVQAPILRITITGFKSREGTCPVALYERDGFNDPDRAIAREMLAIDGDSLVWEVPLSEWMTRRGIDNLEGIQLAVSAYHDRNGNGKLDKNSFGLPTERYGFSNDPKRGFGPPSFEQTAIDVGKTLQGQTPIALRLH